MHWWLAEQEAHQVEPTAIALLQDAEGCITETAGANLLIVREGAILSPPSQSILGGISLLTIKELAAELGHVFQEKRISLYDCLTADEVFLASTPYCLAGVSRINSLPIPWPGPIFQSLLEAWSSRVGVDICRQILFNP
jgi:branched-subunit amino acid aminotransferase/4-amino-4-deoxychorismate lyase